MNETDMMNTLGNNSDLFSMLAWAWMVMNIFMLITFLLKAWWLYNINKKLWEKYAWLSWIPVLQIYNLFTASQKSWITYLLYPVIAIIAWIFLSMFTFWLSLLIAILYAAIMWVKLLSAISTRTWRGAWTTLGFIFIPYIMYPVVWYKLKEKSENNTKNNEEVIEKEEEKSNESKKEEKIEL